jgi:uncharacterized protein (TIGR02391 family)
VVGVGGGSSINMSSLSYSEKQKLEKLFKMQNGFVLNFSDRTFREFFLDELAVDIGNEKYYYNTPSKANRLRAFWRIENSLLVSKSISKMIDYISLQISEDLLDKADFPESLIFECTDISNFLSLFPDTKNDISEPTKTVSNAKEGNITIQLRKEVFSHVQSLLESGHFYNAVEEAYKIVRAKLKEVTGSDKATDAFKPENMKIIFGSDPIDQSEKDFFDGVKYLHMSMQFFRNEKSHKPSAKIDQNLAIHYIVLASLGFDLIDRKII